MSGPRKFRKLPVEIEAIRWDGTNHWEILKWMGERYISTGRDGKHLSIHTLEGVMQAGLGDWIIRGVADEFYPCKPEIFAATYEEVAA